MRFHVIIPARYASTRLPGKPLLLIDGLPMVVLTSRQALLAGAASVTVATDDERIARVCEAHQLPFVMTRTDHPTGTDRLVEAAQQLGLEPESIVVNVQGDEPHIPPECISQAARLLVEAPEASMSTLAHPIHDIADFANPNVVKCVTGTKGQALYFSRAMIPYPRDAFAKSKDSLPEGLPILRHVGLYAYRVRFLNAYPSLSPSPLEQFESLEQLRALANGHRIQVGIIPEALPAGVDTLEDYQRLSRKN
jgi:3-deoxy-manno-octulosonate cytidylyltransferase (CMP-KDO synthetase)